MLGSRGTKRILKKLKEPSVQRQNQILKTKQSGFGAGMYTDPDLPASILPNNAVRWAFNVLLYSGYAEVRPGTERFSTLLPPAIDGRTNYIATKTGFIITKTVGQNFTQADVDSFFWWPESGHRDLIVAVLSVTSIQVRHDDPEGPSTAALPGKIMAPENARKIFHNSSRLLFAFFGTEIYWTSWYMDQWNRLPLRSGSNTTDIPISSASVFDQNQSNVFLINPNGIFVVDTRQDPMEYFKINTVCPNNTITEVPVGGPNVFGRRYLHSMSRLIGRTTENRFNARRIQNESGTNNIDHVVESQDYRIVFGVDPAAGNRAIGPITYPVGVNHWTHIPIYATDDLALDTTDPERYVLLDEVPIAKAYDAYRNPVNGNILINPGGNGEFSEADVGNDIEFSDGTIDTITAFVSVNEVQGTGILLPVLAQGAAIGGGRVMDAGQTGTLITRTAGDLFLATDAGLMLFWADGYYSFITEFIDGSNVRALTSAAHALQGATIQPVSRYYNDRIPDDTLNNRAVNYSLYQRFWQPLPVLTTGVVVPGFIIVAKAGVDEIHYSQIPTNREYLAGYYNQYYQMAPIKDNITSLREFKDRIIIYCANSTYWAATNVTLSAEVPSIGEYVSVLAGVNILDLRIGVKDRGGIQRLRNGEEIVVTSEPGLRICNGQTYSSNYAVDAYGRSYVLNELQKAQQSTAAGYDPNKLGYLLFFSDQP